MHAAVLLRLNDILYCHKVITNSTFLVLLYMNTCSQILLQPRDHTFTLQYHFSVDTTAKTHRHPDANGSQLLQSFVKPH